MSDFLPLGDVCSLITKGTTPNAKLGGFSYSGVNYVKSESLSYSGGVDETKFVCISEATHQKLKRSILQERDILMSIAGANLGKVGMAKKHILPANTNQAVAIIRVDPEKANPEFVQYYLRNPSFVANSLAGVAQSAQPNLNLSEISRFEIPNYSIFEQQDIASSLGVLDDKIELNRRMSATLEEMARALYRSWFVDFDPVHARALGQSPAHMTPTTAALFPDSFGPDGLPKGWEYSTLDAMAKVTMGLSPKGSTYNDTGQGVPLCNGPVEYGDYFLRKVKWTTAPTRYAQNGDLILCVRGSTTGRHSFADSEYCIGRGVAGIRGYDATHEFVEIAMLSSIDRLLEKAVGSVFPSLGKDDIAKFEIINPNASLIDTFCNFARPLRQKVWANHRENETLATLRNTLLPRLMSGDLRIREAEKQVKEVVCW